MTTVNRRTFIRNVGAGALAMSVPGFLSQCVPGTRQPNILFIMSDDHASHAISAYGSKLIQTPNLDRLAREGMLFTNCFCTNSICAPSRACVLTGKYSSVNGLTDNSKTFDGSQTTVPKLLKESGYQTALFGKWHLKSEPTGFDFYRVLPGQGDYINPKFMRTGHWGEPEQQEGYVTDLITEDTINWIEQRDPGRPFFVMCHHKAPHRNWEPDPDLWDEFKDREFPEPETLFDDYASRGQAAKDAEMTLDRHMHPGDTGGAPPEGLSGKDLTRWRYQRYMRRYLACVKSIDNNIGRLLTYLDQAGLADHTMVVYTSDQGFYLGDHGWFDKRFMYEESLKMPLLIRYPERVRPDTETDDFVLNIDFAPTFLSAAGAAVSAEMQGESFIEVLKGKRPSGWRKDMYYRYYEYPGWHMVDQHYGIRTDTFKLIHYYGYLDEWELFDLKKDPYELNNVYHDPDYRQVVADLTKRLYELQRYYGESRPVPAQIPKSETSLY